MNSTSTQKLKKKADEEHDDSSDLSDLLAVEKLNLGPRRKLLVLSIGGLFVERIFIWGRPTDTHRSRSPDAVVGSFRIYKRPSCDDFLRFCFQRFEVGLWSGAMEPNMDGVLRTLAYDVRGRFAFIWDQAQCIDSGFKSLTKKSKPIFLKKLQKIWDNQGGSIRRWPKGTYSSSNTLLIDTEPSNALLNPPNTAIFLDEYKASQLGDSYLGPSGDLRNFLSGLESADDVPTYVEKHPIGQPPITPLHPDWNFYNKIINSFQK